MNRRTWAVSLVGYLGASLLRHAQALCDPRTAHEQLMIASMSLIRYRPEHREPVLALHRSAIVGFTLGMSQQEDEADLMAIEHVYLREGGEFLVGFIDQKLVAMGGFKRLSDASAELRRMRIERELQGRGYGTQLLRELERRGYESGIRTLCLYTAKRRPLTLEFYRRHGYQETGLGLYGAVETVEFSKTLDAG
jgi:GNAT superfamily N-acetyltransferase